MLLERWDEARAHPAPPSVVARCGGQASAVRLAERPPGRLSERYAGAHARPGPDRAVDVEVPGERLDAVGKAEQARAARRVGAAGAVVGHLDERPAVTAHHGHTDLRRAGV